MADDDVSQSGFAASATTLPLSWGAEDFLLELRLVVCGLVGLGFHSFSSYSNTGPEPELDDRVWADKCVATESTDGLRKRGLEWGLIGLETEDGCNNRSRKASSASRVSFFLNRASSWR